ADQRCRLHREVRWVQALQRRKLTVAELVEPLRLSEVSEPVLTEVTQLDVAAEQVACRLGDQHLPAVPGRRDPGRTMDIDPDVSLLGDDRLACVQAHAYANRPLAQRLLGVRRCCERVLRTPKGDEEGVTLRVDLDAVVAVKDLAQKAPVVGERVDVAVAELMVQPRRAFDVREEERDSAGWQLAHALRIARSAGKSNAGPG